MNDQQTGRTASSPGPAYLLAVGGLLVLIIAMLAVLWLRERNRRVAAETELQRSQQAGGSILPGLLPGMLERAVQPSKGIQRDDLSPESVSLDGRSRTAFRISAKAGERIGFRPGDVVIVSPAATSSPEAASAPAE